MDIKYLPIQHKTLLILDLPVIIKGIHYTQYLHIRWYAEQCCAIVVKNMTGKQTRSVFQWYF